MQKNMYRIIRNNILLGILVLAPLVLTLITLKWIFYAGTNFAVNLMHESYRSGTAWLIRIIFVSSIIAFLIFLGFMARFIFIKKCLIYFDKAIYRIPLLGIIYRSLKQILNVFIDSKIGPFKHVVLFEYPRPGIYTFGFVTSRSKYEIHKRTGKDDINSVFIGTAPNPITGLLAFVPQKELKGLEMSVMDGIKLIFSGGIITPERSDAQEDFE